MAFSPILIYKRPVVNVATAKNLDVTKVSKRHVLTYGMVFPSTSGLKVVLTEYICATPSSKKEFESSATRVASSRLTRVTSFYAVTVSNKEMALTG